MNDRWIIFGAGGHGKVVLDILCECGVDRSDISFVDSNAGGSVLGVRILRPRAADKLVQCQYVIAIGDCEARAKVYDGMLKTQHLLSTVVHPSATVSRFATLGPGVCVAAQAHIGPGAIVGRGTIINTGAVVEHDSHVGEWCHIGPGAKLCGGVRVGRGTFIGANAVIKPGIKIGSGVRIGCGAAVVKNIPDRCTWAGVPARELVQQ